MDVQKVASSGWTDEEKNIIAQLFRHEEGKEVLRIIEKDTIRKGIPPVIYNDGMASSMATAFRNGENNLALRIIVAANSAIEPVKRKNK